MSNYIEPKMDWRPESVPTANDFNRMEGNTDYLQKNKIDNVKLAANNGVATLDENGNVVQKAVTISSLSFTGGVSESFNGSVAKSIAIPTLLPTPYELTVGTKRFNGSTAVSIVKSDLGLGYVDNTSDVNKPVSIAQQAALNTKVDKITGKQLSTEDYSTADKNKLAGIAAGAQVNTVTGIKGDAETSFRTGNINLTKANIGLSNVNNTADSNKPVSAAQQAALNTKVDKITGKQLSTEDYTSAEKAKLANIAASANNYVHPASHPASIIAQDANNRFMTDAERNKLSGIAAGAQVNTVTGVKGSNESAYRTGNISLTATNVGALPITGGTVNGSISATSFTATSDRRLKDDIETIEKTLSDKLLQLDVITYYFKGDPFKKRHIGVVAQDLEELMKNDAHLIVTEGEDGFKRIEPSGILFMLLDLVKKQERRITELESRVQNSDHN